MRVAIELKVMRIIACFYILNLVVYILSNLTRIKSSFI